MLRSAISSKVPNFRCYGPLSAVSGINATFNSPELRNRVQENQSHFKQQKSVTFCSIARFPKNSLDVCSTGRFLPCKRVTTLDLFKKSEVISRFQSSTATLESSSDGDISSIGCKRSGVRNVAIIAHVDHGKTTLVDQLLRACSSSSDQQSEERLLDCGELEKLRGITISSKVTRCFYRDTVLNIVDSPGHADFAGEVDRIMSLVDGVCLVVDAAEGPMAQTKYVLSRALSMGLKPIVVLNKADRPDSASCIESGETESQLLDLFDALGASEDQMDYETIYASARNGWATEDLDLALSLSNNLNEKPTEEIGMDNLLDCILQSIPEPKVEVFDSDIAMANEVMPGEAFENDKFSMAAVTVGYDSYLGRTTTGRVHSGSISLGDDLVFLKATRNEEYSDSEGQGIPSESSTVSGIFINKGISRTPLDPGTAYAGDIVTISGVPDEIAVGDTLTKVSHPVEKPLKTLPVAPPILAMEFGANDGPLKGKEGTKVTPSKVRNRLIAETDNNVTLSVEQSKNSDKTMVYARGELQLGILIEQMRREGYELIISPPKIVTKFAEDGKTVLEPFEEVTVDVDAEYSGSIVSTLTGDRKGVLLDMFESAGKTRLKLEVPSRGLLGFHTEVATTTRGSAVVNHVFLEDRCHAGPLGNGLLKGKLISSESGKASQYALSSLAARGVLFIEPGDVVYNGMVIGENSKTGDLDVNPIRAKAATNMRTQNKDERVYLQPAKKMSVEDLLGYMATDEMLEVTPKSLRLRKRELCPVERRRASRVKKQQQDVLKKNN